MVFHIYNIFFCLLFLSCGSKHNKQEYQPDELEREREREREREWEREILKQYSMGKRSLTQCCLNSHSQPWGRTEVRWIQCVNVIVLTCTSCGLCSDTQPVHTNISDTKVTAIELSTCYYMYMYSWRKSILLLLLQFPIPLHCSSRPAPFSFVLNDSQPQEQIPYSRKYWRELNLMVEPKSLL